MLLPPIDQGWHGGPATRRSAFRRCDRSRFSSRSLMMLLNPLSLSVATHLSLDSTRARWWNPSDLAAWARPPHPENRSTAVLVGGSAALLLLLWSVSVFTPSKRAVRLSVVGRISSSGWVVVDGGVGGFTPSSGCSGGWVVGNGGSAGDSCGVGGFTPSSGCLGGWVVGSGGTAGGSCGAEVSYWLDAAAASSRSRSLSLASRTASLSFCPWLVCR